MSSTMLVENEKISFKDVFIFEGIKPQRTEFGINSKFNDGRIFKINNIYATTFKYNNLIYTVIINEDVVGFHLSDFKEVNEVKEFKELKGSDEFDYISFILDSETLTQISNNNALSIFSYVFYIIEHIINKYNLKTIKFIGENTKLKELYSKLVKNKLFIKEFNKLGFEYLFDEKYHIFKMREKDK